MRRPHPRSRLPSRGAAYEPRRGPPLGKAWPRPTTRRRSGSGSSWRALCAAQWSEAQAWREALYRLSSGPASGPGVTDRACSPSAVVHILQLLVAERTLTRQAATGIEDVLLPHVGRTGEWQRGGE